MSNPNTFTDPQKEYLKGFFSAVEQRTDIKPFLGKTAQGQFTNEPAQAVEEENIYGTPIEDLCKEEKIKYEKNGLDVWDTMVANGEANEFPALEDIFRYKFFGFFHVKPAQNSFMMRCRTPGCILQSHQLRGLAEITEDWGSGNVDLTTRGNTQVREIMPPNVVNVFTKLTELGLTSKGSGADNLRNITASPTTGFDPEELFDVMPYAKAMHHYILNNRDMYGLPRKFNISFDNGGPVSVCADTNDIAFYATEVKEGHDVEPGMYFRVQLCGITGHKQFASDSGILIKPEQSVAVAAAMVRVFVENGDRTNRKKARLKYLVDKWGIPKFLEETQKKLAFDLTYFDIDQCEPRKPIDQQGHMGVHKQKEEGLNYVGVITPVGRISADRAKQIADVADEFGAGELRLTVWQNIIIPHVKDADIDALTAKIKEIGFEIDANSFAAGLIACTGNTGCKFAASNTKFHATELAKTLGERLQLDTPINIHLTGCPHSCAQHYIGDIGLQGASAKYQGESVEGYHVAFGGGVDNNQAIAEDMFKAVPFQELPDLLEGCLKIYLDKREGKETFSQFTRRHTAEELQHIFANYVN